VTTGGYGSLDFVGVTFDWQDDGSLAILFPTAIAPVTLTGDQAAELGAYLAGALGPILPTNSPPEPPPPSSASSTMDSSA
jgi:hypothetical protein